MDNELKPTIDGIKQKIRSLAVELTCYTHPRHGKKRAKLHAEIVRLQAEETRIKQEWAK